MKLKSPSFVDHGKIPKLYTCEGRNVNPPLLISEVPKEAKSLVLIMEDPDVPKEVRIDGMYDHWVLFNIPPTIEEIKEDQSVGVEGRNTSGTLGYTGPCPPDREHRYFFKLFALDIFLSLVQGASKKDVEKAMKHHVIEEVVLIGLYEKKVKDEFYR